MKSTVHPPALDNVVPFPAARRGHMVERHWARHLVHGAADAVCERTLTERTFEVFALILFAVVCAGNVALILTALHARLHF